MNSDMTDRQSRSQQSRSMKKGRLAKLQRLGLHALSEGRGLLGWLESPQPCDGNDRHSFKNGPKIGITPPKFLGGCIGKEQNTRCTSRGFNEPCQEADGQRPGLEDKYLTGGCPDGY